MSITKKSNVVIIVLFSIIVIGILILLFNNLVQKPQSGRNLQKKMNMIKEQGKDFKKVNINTAGLEKLVKLPGVGPVKAQAIIEYRDNIGKFESINEITNVKGIGEATLAKLLPYLEIIGDSAEQKSFQSLEADKTLTKKININTASLNELTNLPGIGEKKAQAIIKYREEVGDFQTKDDTCHLYNLSHPNPTKSNISPANVFQPGSNRVSAKPDYFPDFINRKSFQSF